MSMVPESRQSSITVAVRVRPFSSAEEALLLPEVSPQSRIIGLPFESVGGTWEGAATTSTGDSRIVLPGTENDQDSLEKSGESDGDSVQNRPVSTQRTNGIWKIVDCVDNKMLIFDPPTHNPLAQLSQSTLNSSFSQRRRNRRRRTPSGNFANTNSGEMKFVFDQLFDDDASQSDVYSNTMSPLIASVLDGFNATVFAYGATGCGKTYTISGTPEEPGIIFQAMEELFQRIEQLGDTEKVDVSLSFLEIYNERIRDLLEPETSSKRLVIRDDDHQRTTVANLSYHYPKTVQEVIDLVIQGNMNRTTEATEANEVSSRSHAVLQVHLVQTNKKVDLTTKHKYATLSIIDLAGSERAAATKNRGKRLHEGANINRSLLALGNCINALCLSDGTRRTCHIPYRDSKLTRLLKFSLGGNCKTVMIVCISPSSNHYDETLNTLKYANRAKEIKTKIIRNQQSLSRHVGSYLKMITEQKAEIEELRARESRMIELKLKEYKLSNRKIELQINDVVGNVSLQYVRNPKYRVLKKLRSLTLVKRRFLQLVKLEVDSVLGCVSEYTDTRITSSCELVANQLIDKIRELEIKFDTKDELDLIITHTQEVDLLKLKEMENWEEAIHLPIFENKLDNVSEALRNEIMIDASMMLEKLLQDSVLVQRFKFFSTALVNEQDIYYAVQDLTKIDSDFDEFAQSFLNAEDESNDDITGVDEPMVPMRKISPFPVIREADSREMHTVSVDMLSDSEAQTDKNLEEASDTDPEVRHTPLGHVEKSGATTLKKLRWSESLNNSPESSSNGSAPALRQPSDSMEVDISLQDTTITTQDSLQRSAVEEGGGKAADTSYTYSNTSLVAERGTNNILNAERPTNEASSILLRRNFLTDDTA